MARGVYYKPLMKAVIVVDSVYGNTRKIAEAMYSALGPGARLIKAWEFQPDMLIHARLVIFGSPINVWRPTANMLEALERLKEADLHGKKVAAFDSRYDKWWAGTACHRIARALKRQGGQQIAKSQHFIVLGHEGPLREGEEKRAADWARMLVKKASL